MIFNGDLKDQNAYLEKHGIELRQNYNLVAKRLSVQIGRYLHARQMKRAKKAGKLKVILGRVTRGV